MSALEATKATVAAIHVGPAVAPEPLWVLHTLATQFLYVSRQSQPC
jgi:hypothetical protein